MAGAVNSGILVVLLIGEPDDGISCSVTGISTLSVALLSAVVLAGCRGTSAAFCWSLLPPAGHS